MESLSPLATFSPTGRREKREKIVEVWNWTSADDKRKKLGLPNTNQGTAFLQNTPQNKSSNVPQEQQPLFSGCAKGWVGSPGKQLLLNHLTNPPSR